MTTTVINQAVKLVSIPHGMKCTIIMAASSTALVERIREEAVLETVSVIASETRIFGEYFTDMTLRISCLTGSLTYDVAQRTDDALDLSYSVQTTHPLSFEGVKLAANTNVIRGASVNPTRTSGWVSFSGTIGATPAQCYTDYRELHTTGVAEVLGIGSFPYMDSGASCASMFGGQDIAYASTGSTVLTAAAAPAVGIFGRFIKTVIDGATFNSGGVAAAIFAGFQANVTDVQAHDTSILNAEVASGGIQNIIKFQCSAAKGATYFANFTDDNGEPVSLTNGTDLADISATANAGWIKVLVGATVRYIPLYAAKAA